MNHLSSEKSPYLLQHAGNPVDWYPWGAKAFDRALSEDRPIFLSIGYSTCHWCHVMERESFEDEQVAALMNGHFICVKVDREERPDIDGVYMDAAVMMTGRGGWPLTILMTPAGRPFYAATYLPRESRFGMPGLMDLLPRVAELWRDSRTELLETADRVRAALEREAGTDSLSAEDAAVSDAGDVSASPSRGGDEITESHIAAAAAELAARFDARHGGFGSAPKFPSAHNLIFLTRRWHETGKENLLAMVEKTLRSMRAGGIYDHVGFGFHRYSTDEMWLVPHFEKMLYDQAMLALAYTEAALATGAVEYERTAREVIEYVLRDMTSPEGAFYSAEDADTEGVEGKFYVWTRSELEEVLGPDDAKLAMLVFGVSGEDAGILHLARPIAEVAPELGISPDALAAHLDPVRERLHAARGRRTRPSRDDKVLTDWNGLMISALAVAARAFGEDTYAEAAQRAAGFILAVMRDEEGRLLHRFRDGEAAIRANADDYAFLTGGRLDLYETTFAPRHLEEAVRLNREFVEHFLDRRHGGFFFTPDDGERLIVRKKEVHDGALPSGNSVAMRNLIRLSRMTGDPEFEGLAAKLSRAFSEDAALNPAAHTMLLSSAQHALSPTREVVVAGRADAPDTKEMLAALGRTYDPNRSVLLRDPGVAPGVTAVAPWTSGLVPVDGRATAYVCRSRRCGLPTSSASEMLDMLARH